MPNACGVPYDASVSNGFTRMLALLIGIAGWFYLFYSQGAKKLSAVEPPAANRRRGRLRRVNGAAMILLAIGLYVAGEAIDPNLQPRRFVIVWLAIFALLLLIVALGLIDIRLTARLRGRQEQNPD